MEYKLLDKKDVELMEKFVDDENTHYDQENLTNFLNHDNNYGFIVKDKNRIVGFAYGYLLIKPNGRKDFYLHAIDIMKPYQNNGYGTELIRFINEYTKNIGCTKMFLITNKSNTAACKCYEKSGGLSKNTDDIVYVFE